MFTKFCRVWRQVSHPGCILKSLYFVHCMWTCIRGTPVLKLRMLNPLGSLVTASTPKAEEMPHDGHMVWYDIYILTAIGLSPGGSITVRIYTQTVLRTTQITTNLEECGPCRRLCEILPWHLPYNWEKSTNMLHEVFKTLSNFWILVIVSRP